MHVTVNLKPALSPEHEEGTPPSLFQTCPVVHILAPCYYFSLQFAFTVHFQRAFV